MDVDRVGVTLTDQNFHTTVLESPRPVLVVLTAAGCGPWHRLAPEIAALAEACRGQVTVGTLDVEAEPQTPQRYGIGTLPAVVVFHEGRVVAQLPGVEDTAAIATTLQALARTRQT
jgi:thioredoxin 1